MASDKIRDEDRARFEAVFMESNVTLMRAFVDAGLPNEYIEQALGRMMAYRAAVTGEPIAQVAARVQSYAQGYSDAANFGIKVARMLMNECEGGGKN